ncbi:MAG: N-formylglutamate amidohydrolase [Myxococcales bacterium]|nr:N-formylglutamate amidohydrolase [Myxococcales bacterium]
MPHRPPFRVVGDPDRAAGPFLSCEHASNRLVGVEATAADRAVLDDHWGWDPGAAWVTEALVELTDGVAVLSDFSRLLVDPNRPPDSPSLVVTHCDGHPVSFNQGLAAAAIEARLEALWRPYHAAVEATARRRLARGPAYFVSVHSFTPTFAGAPRPMEVGVLFDDLEEDAARLAEALRAEGFATALNAPYSGRNGLIYAIERHGRALGAPHLELEVRQDLLSDRAAATAVAARVARALRVLTP